VKDSGPKKSKETLRTVQLKKSQSPSPHSSRAKSPAKPQRPPHQAHVAPLAQRAHTAAGQTGPGVTGTQVTSDSHSDLLCLQKKGKAGVPQSAPPG
jgi:hypothetical protein